MKDGTERHAAWMAGKVRYSTGIPCKHGHIAERFVSNGGCVQCVSPFKQRRSAFDKNAAPFASQRLWVRSTYTLQQREALDVYLQQCIDVFDRATCPNDPPVMRSAPPQPIGYTTAPPGAGVLPSLESLPSGSERRSKCKHGVDLGFCDICDVGP